VEETSYLTDEAILTVFSGIATTIGKNLLGRRRRAGPWGGQSPFVMARIPADSSFTNAKSKFTVLPGAGKRTTAADFRTGE